MNTQSQRTSKSVIKVGTRGSELALTQTGHVIEALGDANPELAFEIVVIKTTGDKDQRPDLASLGVGVFVRELEDALLDGRVDLAVHSLKDMPSSLPPDFALAAVPPREDPRDALISRSGQTLADLPPGARVATGSPRRQALVKNQRPDLIVESLRGNVPTRLAKIDDADGPDAMVLATAGLNRLGLQSKISQHLPSMDFVAAVGQGALALETRIGDDDTTAIAAILDHRDTRLAITAERAFLQAVGGGCSASVSAHAKVTGEQIEISAFAATPDGSTIIRERSSGKSADAADLGLALGESFVKRGARQLVTGDSE
jgi:hydroxymethylbilane synthase